MGSPTLTKETAEAIKLHTQPLLSASMLPGLVKKQRELFGGINTIVLDAIRLGAKSREIHQPIQPILEYCAQIDSLNSIHYSNIPGPVLTRMDSAVKGIRDLLNGKTTSANGEPSTNNPAASAPVAKTPVSIVTTSPSQPERKTESNLDQELIDFGREHQIVTQSLQMEDSLDILRFLAEHEGHVLIRGETGTGKELFSKALHKASKRKNNPFVLVDGATVDTHLIKDELFGHMKGAFTGADKTTKGKLEIAGKGVIFLDEIGRWNLDAQGILLGILEGRDIQKIGSNGESTTPMEARIVAATNADLEDLVNRGLFMEDLYYRLQQLRLELPPLRDRKNDIQLLGPHFLKAAQSVFGIDGTWEIDELASKSLQDYPWPGNVRQLKHVMEQALVNAAREHARQKRLAKGANGHAHELVIMQHHVAGALETYSRLKGKLPADDSQKTLFDK